MACVHVRRIYTDGLAKDSKQSFISWLVAITTLTIYTGVPISCMFMCLALTPQTSMG
jgi:hypothetical protein